MAVSLSQGSFLGLVFETLFYGTFLFVFAVSIYSQWERRREVVTAGNKMVVGFSIILFCLITTHWWLNVWGCYDIYTNVGRGTATELAFADLRGIKSMVRLTLYQVQVWMGDVFLICRLYHSRKNIKHIIFPSIACVVTVVCSCNLLHLIAISDSRDPLELRRIRDLSIATFSVILIENAYCAALIAFHSWKTQDDTRYVTQLKIGPVLRVSIESAALWIVFTFITFMLYVADTSAYLIMLYLTNTTLGISYCLMTTRLRIRTRRTFGFGNNTGGSSASAACGSRETQGIPARKLCFNVISEPSPTSATLDSMHSIPLVDMRYSSESKRARGSIERPCDV